MNQGSEGLKYVNDGQTVMAFVKGRWLRCVVACAAGNLARIENQLHGVNDWFPVHHLRKDES